MQTQPSSALSAEQIAAKIDRNNNGYPTMGQAFIALIKGRDLPDGEAILLFRSALEIKQLNSGSLRLLH